MQFPEKYRYTKDHEWISREGEVYTVGITDFAQSELGELVFVELPEGGKKISQGGRLCVVESTKAASDVYAPVNGTVHEVNSALSNEPDRVNKEPHAGGWLVKLTGVSTDEFEKLMDAKAYTALVSGAK